MKRYILPALVVIPLALAGVAVAASGGDGQCDHHGPRGGHGHPPGPPIEMIAQHLDLDDAQQADLEALRDAFIGEFDKGHDAREAFRESAAAELRSDAPDFDKLATLATEQAEAMHARHLEGIQAIADFAATLTPEQRASLAEHLESGPPHERFGGKHGRH